MAGSTSTPFKEGPFPPPPGPAPFGDRLFRNRGDGRFEDVTAAPGWPSSRAATATGSPWATTTTTAGPTSSSPAGGPTPFITTSAMAGSRTSPRGRAWAAIATGRPRRPGPTWTTTATSTSTSATTCNGTRTTRPSASHRTHDRVTTYCDPRAFPALPDHVFRNDGGRFVDVTEEAGIVDRDGRGLGVVAADLDDDGKIDLFVANDTTANYFFRNQGGFRFAEEGLSSGLAASAGGGYLAGMGVACGDFDGDGRLDLAVTNFFDESTTLYHNHGGGIFSDRSAAAGPRRADPLRARLRARRARCEQRRPARPGAGQRPCQRLPPRDPLRDARAALPGRRRRQAHRRLGPRRAALASPPARPRTGRRRPGQRRPHRPAARRRERPARPASQSDRVSQNHFLTLALEGTASNRDAVGAGGRDRLGPDPGRRAVRRRQLPFGERPPSSLRPGTGPKADRVEVTWPSGRRDCYHGLAADAGYRLRGGPGTQAPARLRSGSSLNDRVESASSPMLPLRTPALLCWSATHAFIISGKPITGLGKAVEVVLALAAAVHDAPMPQQGKVVAHSRLAHGELVAQPPDMEFLSESRLTT